MQPPIDVVGRISAVLRIVAASEPQGLKTSEIADSVGLPRPTCHRLLTRMNVEGLIDRATGGEWLVGPELFLLAIGAAPRYDVRNIAQPILRELAVSTGESATFSVRRGEETVCLLHEEGTFPLRSHVLHEGARFPLGVASAGLAILAFLPETERNRYLKQTTLEDAWGDQHTLPLLEARLAEAREVGYATNPGLITRGSWGMSAAVFDRRERPVGAISLSGIELRFAAERRHSLGTQLLAAAQNLSTQMSREPGQGVQRWHAS